MFVWDILFPRRCFGCGYLGAYICSRCARALLVVSRQTCVYCGGASLWGLTHPRCQRRCGIDGCLSLFVYDPLLRKIIKGIKYSLVTEALRDLDFLVRRECEGLLLFFKKIRPDFVVAVPLHGGRMRERGFNQAESVALLVSDLAAIPLIQSLKRTKSSHPQAQSSRFARRLNVRGVFCASEPVRGRVLLIDDVVTTGETAKEACRVLKKAGAEKVYVFAVAKGKRD